EVARERLEATAKRVGPLVLRVEAERLIEVLDPPRELAQVAVGESPVEPGIDVTGLERKAVVEVVNGIAIPAKEPVAASSSTVRFRVIQTKLDPISVRVD